MSQKTAVHPAEATGYSQSYSFDEAFREALAALPDPPFSFPDQLLRTQVVAVGSERGGIAGLDRMYVTLRREPDPFTTGTGDPRALGGDIPFPFGTGVPGLSSGGAPVPLPGQPGAGGIGGAPGLREPRRVYSVESVHVDVAESRPPLFSICASGLASSSGWSFAFLRPIPRKRPPEDGVYDFELMAFPPSGMVLWVLSPITTVWPLLWQPEDGGEVQGIRVVAADNEQTVDPHAEAPGRRPLRAGVFEDGAPGGSS